METNIILGLRGFVDSFRDPVRLQLWGMVLALLGAWLVFYIYRLQIRERRVFAASALVGEINSNMRLIKEYIQHSDVGSNLTKGTYELNVPERAVYDQYLGLACQNHLDLAEQIRQLYYQFFAYKVYIEMIHSFLAGNLIILFTMDNGKDLLNNGVVTINLSLKRLSDQIHQKGDVDKLIDRLRKIKK